MKMDTFETKDEEIDSKEIMRRIRENIKRRKENWDSTRENSNTGESTGDIVRVRPEIEMQKELEYIKSSSDIQNNSYHITSHRHLVGNVLVRARKLVHGEVRRYVDPIISKQRDFNSSIARILDALAQTQTRISSEVDDKLAQTQTRIASEVDDTLAQAQTRIASEVDDTLAQARTRMASEIDERIKAAIAAMNVVAMNENIENLAWLARVLERIVRTARFQPEPSLCGNNGINYIDFEERFRGSRGDIKGRQAALLKYFDGCNNILDIGCGRGEFLELLRDQGIKGKGIDVDEDMISICRSNGLDVELIDALSYLGGIEEDSLDGIFTSQVVEHLEPGYLIEMLKLCYEKLRYDGKIVVETVNPLSFFSFSNFYIDMGHIRPVHPETLKYLITTVRFRAIETKFLSPVDEGLTLKKIAIDDSDQEIKRIIDVINNDIDIANNILFGPQDYVIIARK